MDAIILSELFSEMRVEAVRAVNDAVKELLSDLQRQMDALNTSVTEAERLLEGLKS